MPRKGQSSGMKNEHASGFFRHARLGLLAALGSALLAAQPLTAQSLSVDDPEDAVPSANIALTPPLSGGAAQPATLAPIHREFRRAADGLFYVTAHANGQAVRFVIDTGATVIVLNRQDAARLGLAFETLNRHAQMNTVSGPSAMRWAEIERLEMAGKRIEGLAAAVVEAGPPVSLLGQNALSLLGTVTLRGDMLTID